MDRFDVCHPVTAAWEGGWSNHKADPGGATMYGVTQAVYNAARKRWGKSQLSVAKITKAEALRIYREEYWAPTAVKYNLAPGVDLATYDAAVNSGVSRGVKWLLASVGSTNNAETVKRICRKRLSFMQSLAIWKTFGKGWGNRVADIEAKGVRMALEHMQAGKPIVDKALEAEKNQAAKDEKKATGGAVATAGAAATPAAVDPTMLDPLSGWLLAGLAIAAVVALIYFIVQARAAKARKLAYAAEIST